jgi:D-3-phosphoglycerate dehydrogenase
VSGGQPYTLVVAEGVLTDVEIERAHLSGRPMDVRLASLRTAEQVARETADADAVVVTIEALPRQFIERFGPGLRIIARAGIGLDAIDLEAARERGVAVFHTPDYATEEVATQTMALLLALNRRLVAGDGVARTEWAAWARLKPVIPLSELTVGVVGLGRIGRAVIDRLRPFAGRIVVFDPYVAEGRADVESAGSLDELLLQSDVLTLHLPLTDETRGMIGTPQLALLRPGATVVNVSRGALIDQEALAAALRDGHLAGAGLDVLAVEPPPDEDPILSAPNVILSPHFAWYSEASNRRMRTMAVDGALDYLEGRPVSVGRLAVQP